MKICISFVALALLVLPTWADEGWDDSEEYEDLDIEEPDDDGGSYGGGGDGYDLDDPNANHRAEAIRRDEAGDLSGSVDAFGSAVKFDPKNAGGYADLGVSNMRAAIKGIEVARHLAASRASFEWSKGLLEEGADTESLDANIAALASAEDFYIEKGMYTKEERLKAIAGGRSGNPDRFPKGVDLGGGGGGGGIDGDLVMEIVETAVSKAEGNIMQDVADLEEALNGQIKALRSRLTKLEAQIDFQGTVKSLEDKVAGGASAEAEVDERDEL